MKCLRALVVILILIIPVIGQKSLVLPPDRIVDLTYPLNAIWAGGCGAQ